jgi:hypothetical protein
LERIRTERTRFHDPHHGAPAVVDRGPNLVPVGVAEFTVQSATSGDERRAAPFTPPVLHGESRRATQFALIVGHYGGANEVLENLITEAY